VHGLAGIAGSLAELGAWQRAASIFGAVEAYCERVGYETLPSMLDLQRALGLPEPWMRAEEPVGAMGQLRTAVKARKAPLPPIPEPALAAHLWSEGRSMSIEQAIDEALRDEA
jgi:hypothetical protein